MEKPKKKYVYTDDLYNKRNMYGDDVVYLADEMDTYLTDLTEERDELRASIKGFKIWYMTLRNHNPDSFIKLKEIIPINIINRFEEALKKGGA